jgi:hypothetical protein
VAFNRAGGFFYLTIQHYPISNSSPSNLGILACLLLAAASLQAAKDVHGASGKLTEWSDNGEIRKIEAK